MGTARPVDAVSVNPVTGEVVFYHEGKPVRPVSATTEVTYQRKKGDKILTQAAVSSSNLVADPNRALEEYRILLAVDTNTEEIGGQIISVTCVVLGQSLKSRVPGQTVVRFGPRHCIEFWGARHDQERIGWSEALDALKRNPAYSHDLRVGLIVDAHLGSLTRINEGEEAVFRDNYLPSNIRMIYASSDSANESIANKMLALADKESKHLLKDLVSKGAMDKLPAVNGKAYTHMRFWNR